MKTTKTGLRKQGYVQVIIQCPRSYSCGTVCPVVYSRCAWSMQMSLFSSIFHNSEVVTTMSIQRRKYESHENIHPGEKI